MRKHIMLSGSALVAVLAMSGCRSATAPIEPTEPLEFVYVYSP